MWYGTEEGGHARTRNRQHSCNCSRVGPKSGLSEYVMATIYRWYNKMPTSCFRKFQTEPTQLGTKTL